LIKEGILPEEANVGRLQLGNLKRMGVGTTIRYLETYSNEIKNYLEDHMNIPNVEEAYRVLCQGAILAVFNGYIEAESPVLNNTAQFLSILPAAMQQKILTDKELAAKAFSI
jgi:hypothetical protein